jgi:hypothetical protein
MHLTEGAWYGHCQYATICSFYLQMFVVVLWQLEMILLYLVEACLVFAAKEPDCFCNISY